VQAQISNSTFLELKNAYEELAYDIENKLNADKLA